jgi:tetratricopeptide (TPR) repeat protein
MGLMMRSAWSNVWTWAGLLAAATALIAHNQLSMVFHHAPSVAPGWVIVALAGSCAIKTGKPWRWDGAVVLLFAGLSVVLMVRVAQPVTSQQMHLAQASRALQAGRPSMAMRALDESTQWVASDATTLKWRISLRLQFAAALESAGYQNRAQQVRDEALSLCQPQTFGGLDTYRLDRWRAVVYEHRRDVDGAIEARQRVVEKLPYSLPDRLALGDRLRAAGRNDAAAEAYRAAIHLSNQSYLDPAKQLTKQRQQEIKRYLDTH